MDDLIDAFWQHVKQKARETAHLPVLLGPWKRNVSGWIRVAVNAPGFRYLPHQVRRFCVHDGPAAPGCLSWWSNGGGGGPETGEEGKAAADACALSRGYALATDNGSVRMPHGSMG